MYRGGSIAKEVAHQHTISSGSSGGGGSSSGGGGAVLQQKRNGGCGMKQFIVYTMEMKNGDRRK